MTTVGRVLLGMALASVAVACEPPRPASDIRVFTTHYDMRITPTPLKPQAELLTQYTIVVKDKDTGQPVSGGEGRIFATNHDGVKVDDGLTAGPEVGTYHVSLRFPYSGDWAFGLQFRRDSTQALERTANDWAQTILPAPPLGSEQKKPQ